MSDVRAGADDAPARTAIPEKKFGLGKKSSGLLISLIGIVIIAILWEVVARTGLVPSSVLPTLSDTLAELGQVLTSGEFWSFLSSTLTAWLVGLLVAISIAIPFGVLLGVSERAYNFFRIPIEAIRPVPPVVILPLALLLLGGSLLFQMALIIQGALWPLLIQTIYGIRGTDPVLLDTARSFHLGLWRRLLQVRLPAALPLIATGLKLAAAFAFAVTIVTEIVGGARGIGALLVYGQSGGDLVRVYAITLIAGIVGLIIATIFGLLERRLLSWRPRGKSK